MTNAVGEDRSSFQAVGSWAGDSFAFAKATEGTNWSDPTYAANAASAVAEGKIFGAYHFFHPADSPSAQAQFFTSAVKAQPHQPSVLIADVEITAGAAGAEVHGTEQAASRMHEDLKQFPPGFAAETTGSAALQFLQTVAALAPQCKVILYTDVFMAQNLLGMCSGYPLFIAYYASAPIAPAPWKTWTFWQTGASGPGGGDLDYFNGDLAALQAWASPGSNWTETLVNNLPTLALGAKDGAPSTTWFVRRLQNEVAGYGRWNGLGKATAIADSGTYDAGTKLAVEAVQRHAGIAVDGVAGKDTWTVLIG
jgi:GH25 family lysozyme M1 (1,4-beta-N-acetylmuramidase)